MIRAIKYFLKNKFPAVTKIYHYLRLCSRSFIDHPFRLYIFIENTNIKVPIHNPDVYQLSIGGGRITNGRLYYEEDLIKTAKEMIRGKKVLFDVGAHIGYWSYVAASWGMKVVAFEPVRYLASVIAKTRDRHNLPIMVMPEGNDLDKFVAGTGTIPDFIKIDVDGEEVKIFAGAKNLLQENKPDLMIEIRPETAYLLDELKKIGYKELKRSGEDSVCVFLTKKNRGHKRV